MRIARKEHNPILPITTIPRPFRFISVRQPRTPVEGWPVRPRRAKLPIPRDPCPIRWRYPASPSLLRVPAASDATAVETCVSPPVTARSSSRPFGVRRRRSGHEAAQAIGQISSVKENDDPVSVACSGGGPDRGCAEGGGRTLGRREGLEPHAQRIESVRKPPVVPWRC